ncbi:Histone deacetylase-like amidohydrolase [Anatilimnocola aggregata]|uniref:Histone deacetylase-like amidohydrolase n=1 Tax=Anatilimnocola aggregata TaxID=2528021 RepID=A0A517YCI4_9BACT|nr:histone deacetylase [Anatilimnocola aggregata]QDU27944.1 Histone deacetylase-like amidohydrolase [Anatilimnocola aggregata]
MTLLYHSPLFQTHKTGAHPEKPERLATIDRHFKQVGMYERCKTAEWKPATAEQIERIHTKAYVAELEKFAASGGGRIEADTVMSPESFSVAHQAAGAVCAAVKAVVKGEDKSAMCLVRPPGHHALEKSAMGFCLLNNIAVAAKCAIAEHELDRVLIVDWDVHHGNGTQDVFYTDEQVSFFSMHRWPFYPGTGDKDETGSGRGLGHTKNVPVAFGTPREKILSQFAKELESFAEKTKPQLVLISAGFDAHVRDPIGSLELETEDFRELTKIVQRVADAHAKGRIVSALEGGYQPQRLAESLEVHLDELLKKS